jgi:3-hydroxyacyl-CoA dehydrogenase
MPFTLFGRTIRKIGVIGSGNIGPDIALHFSQNLHSWGVPVVVVDILQAALDAGSAKAQVKMAKAAEKGAFKKEEAEAIFKNLLFTSDYGKLSDADFVIEAAFEKMEVKQRIFDQCLKTCPKTAIFASNSSHMVPEEIFDKIGDKNRCLVIHYFFPAERNILLEVVPAKETDPGLIDYLMRFYEFIGKAPIKVKSRFGCHRPRLRRPLSRRGPDRRERACNRQTGRPYRSKDSRNGRRPFYGPQSHRGQSHYSTWPIRDENPGHALVSPSQAIGRSIKAQ